MSSFRFTIRLFLCLAAMLVFTACGQVICKDSGLRGREKRWGLKPRMSPRLQSLEEKLHDQAPLATTGLYHTQ
jgi:hypothetical protein